ncbi:MULTISPECIES: MarR family winged helix-turn-helix transcriptional regulator [Streptomyces]|uniref:HTH marR-type domain-containing protein n=1 Tax=Streptomyces cacaoi TaxID=1898 RepID=A0A4Y3QX74_STRCI|nr:MULTISPECIES: MarR family transcriptional regulator [Streptomyces]NNG86256.1 MarR family transcriptional regulator [Streptomyces cacaoi]GEB49812.1 hypothetical protein SCA03_23630 [Streptomyces cacaoi]
MVHDEPAGELADEAEEVALAVMEASQLMIEVSARALGAEDESLTLAQLRTLVVLHTGGPVKLASLAGTLGVNPSTATRMTERLERSGFVDRQINPDCRREVVLRLTGAGARLVERTLARRRAEIARWVALIPGRERAELVAGLRALSRAAGGPGTGPGEEVRRTRGIMSGAGPG